MIIRGKEIKSETISLWLNILGFLVGILFYFRLEKNSKQVVPVSNSIHDSVIVIDTKLNMKIHELKLTQDSLIRELRISHQKMSEQKKEVIVVRQQILSTLQSDWDSIDPKTRNAYINQIMSNLKTKSK